jgi:glycosyltransferase involved in cell wall biosynthesis
MIVVALPAFNEEVTIASMVLEALKHVDKVIVVDDGSSDKTAEVARLAGALVVRHERNRGYGAALKTCFETARKINAEAMVILDADGQHNPDEIPTVLAAITSGKADAVCGSRFIGEDRSKMPTYRKVGIKILNIATSMIGARVSDSQCGFRAYSKRAISVIDPSERGMGAGSEILLQLYEKRLKVVEVPVHCNYTRGGSSQRPVYHGLSVISSILRLISDRHPLLFLGLSGLALIFTGVPLGVLVFEVYQRTHMLAFDTVTIMVLSVIIGVLGIFTGMILQSTAGILIRYKKRMRS